MRENNKQLLQKTPHRPASPSLEYTHVQNILVGKICFYGRLNISLTVEFAWVFILLPDISAAKWEEKQTFLFMFVSFTCQFLPVHQTQVSAWFLLLKVSLMKC